MAGHAFPRRTITLCNGLVFMCAALSAHVAHAGPAGPESTCARTLELELETALGMVSWSAVICRLQRERSL